MEQIIHAIIWMNPKNLIARGNKNRHPRVYIPEFHL